MEENRPRPKRFMSCFRWMIRFLGLDLTYSIFNIREARRDGEIPRAIAATIIYLIFMAIFIFECVVIEHTLSQSFSILWLVTNVKFGMLLHGTSSIGFLAGCGIRKVFMGLEKRLGNLEKRAPSKPLVIIILLVVFLLFSALILFIVCVHAADDIRHWIKPCSPLNPPPLCGHQHVFANFWGADPFLRIIAACFTCFATIVYVFTWGPILGNLTEFNKEMRETIVKNSNELEYDKLIEIARRQKELLALVRFANNTMGRYANIGFLGALITHIDALAIVIGQRDKIDGSIIALFTGYMIISAFLVGALLFAPATASYRIMELPKLLLVNTDLVGSRNEEHLPLINHIIQRAESKDNKLWLLGAVRVDENTPHRANLFMLAIGYALVILGRLYGVQATDEFPNISSLINQSTTTVFPQT